VILRDIPIPRGERRDRRIGKTKPYYHRIHRRNNGATMSPKKFSDSGSNNRDMLSARYKQGAPKLVNPSKIGELLSWDN
jgi:hypothetical protein